MGEEWLNVRGFPNYLVSNFGRVYSCKRENLLKQATVTNGYLAVDLYNHGQNKICMVHRLVALHFIPGWWEDAQVNHIDGIKTNNVETNLEWVTAKMNVAHALETGLRLNAHRVINVDTGETFPSVRSCSRYYGTIPQRIHEAIDGGRPIAIGVRLAYLEGAARAPNQSSR